MTLMWSKLQVSKNFLPLTSARYYRGSGTHGLPNVQVFIQGAHSVGGTLHYQYRTFVKHTVVILLKYIIHFCKLAQKDNVYTCMCMYIVTALQYTCFPVYNIWKISLTLKCILCIALLYTFCIYTV